MSLSGRLKDLSIPQVLKLLSDGTKSGLLTLRIFDDVAAVFNKHYLWLEQGAVVSLSTQIDGRDWITWLGEQESLGTIEQRQQLRCLNGELDGYTNLGRYLIEQNYLQPAQIQTLFEQRIVQSIGELFNHNNGFFIFNDRFTVPTTESLGLTIAVRDLNLPGMRQLTNWEIYQTELPEPHVALLCFKSVATVTDLSQWEQRLLQAADGSRSIAQLAKDWGCELPILQQAAFGLIVSGVVEELSMATSSSPNTDNLAEAQRLIAQVGSPWGTIAPATVNPTPAVPQAPAAAPAAPNVVVPSNAFLSNLGQFFNRRLATATKPE